MPIHVVPHAGRWAVKVSPDAMPIAEYETRELAELAARDLAAESGTEVVVDHSPAVAAEGEPANVHTETDPGTQAPDGIDRRTSDLRGAEEPRVEQAGM